MTLIGVAIITQYGARLTAVWKIGRHVIYSVRYLLYLLITQYIRPTDEKHCEKDEFESGPCTTELSKLSHFHSTQSVL